MVSLDKGGRASAEPPLGPEVESEAALVREEALRILKERLTWAPSITRLVSLAASGVWCDGPVEARQADSSRAQEEEDVPLTAPNEENLRQLQEVLAGTVSRQGSTSVFLIGPRGTGKTLVTHRALRGLMSSFGASGVFPLYINARLLGEEQHALNSIVSKLSEGIDRVLQRHEGAPEQPIISSTDLRGLLERYFQVSSAHARQDELQKNGGLKGTRGGTVVLVLDEFEVFASRNRQTLLYSVFDSLQSPAASLVVVGVTCRHDAEQLLEKRVRSRHSGRKIVFTPPTADNLTALAEKLLTLPDSAPGLLSSAWTRFADPFNSSVRRMFHSPSALPPVLLAHFAEDLSPPAFLRLLFRAVCSMGARGGHSLDEGDLEVSAHSSAGAARLGTLLGLSVLELFLLVCMRRLEMRQQELYTFAAVFQEYQACARKGGSSDVLSKEAALQAFVRLKDMGLVVGSSGIGVGRKDMQEFAPVRSTVFPVEIEVAVEKHKHCPNAKLRSLLSQNLHQGAGSLFDA